MKCFIFFVILLSCSSQVAKQDLPASQQDKTANIAIYENNPSSHFKFHGQINGLGCTRSQALEAAKVKAVVLKANTIVNLHCQKSKADWISACKITLNCSGDAVTIK